MFQLVTTQVQNYSVIGDKKMVTDFEKRYILGVCQQASSSNVIYKDCFASCNGKEAGNANCNNNNDVVKMFEDDKVNYFRTNDNGFESCLKHFFTLITEFLG